MFLSIICFFNNSLLYCTIHCQINISESESESGELSVSETEMLNVNKNHVYVCETGQNIIASESRQNTLIEDTHALVTPS